MVPQLHRHRGGVAIVPQTVNAAATLEGTVIENPHLMGQTLEFRIIAGSLNSVTVLTIRPMGRRADDGNWERIGTQHDPDGDTTELQFDAADTIDGEALENGSLRGTLPISRLRYDAYRLDVDVVTGANVTLGAVYNIFDLHDTEVNQQKDHFLFTWNDDGHYADLNPATN